MSTAPSALGVERFVPAVGWLRSYRAGWLRSDVVAGLAAGAVVLPQAMAYATVAGLPAEFGLYTCMVPMVVYALLGGSRVLSFSTTSTVAMLSGSTLAAAHWSAGTPDPARSLATLTVLVGVMLLAARLLRLGSAINGISEATLTGIKTGVALTIAAAQLPKLLGVPGKSGAKAVGQVDAVLGQLGDVGWVTVAVSVGTIGGALLLARIAPRVPAALIAIAAGIALVAFAHLDDHGVALVEPIASGLPTPVLPRLDGVGSLALGALAIALMSFVESASAANALRKHSEPPIDNNQELLANGSANVLGGLFRGMPSGGGFSQSAVNDGSGARTELSGLVTAGLAVACALFLGGVLSDLPAATLGSLVIVGVVGLIAPSTYVRYWRYDPTSFWVAVTVTAAAVAFGLVQAVVVGVGLTLLTLLRELNHVDVVELRPTADADDLLVVGSDASAAGTGPMQGLLVLRVDGPLYTANVRNVCDRVAAEVEDESVCVLDVSGLRTVSITVVDAIDELRHRLEDDRGVQLWLAGVSDRAARVAEAADGWELFRSEGRIAPTALAAVRRFVAEHPGPSSDGGADRT